MQTHTHIFYNHTLMILIYTCAVSIDVTLQKWNWYFIYIVHDNAMMRKFQLTVWAFPRTSLDFDVFTTCLTSEPTSCTFCATFSFSLFLVSWFQLIELNLMWKLESSISCWQVIAQDEFRTRDFKILNYITYSDFCASIIICTHSNDILILQIVH